MSPVPALHRALAAVRSASDAVVLVDGRSGSGKTTFAATVARLSGAALLRLDDVYPGWDGLEAAASALVPRVLLPHRRRLPGTVRRWDWRRSAAGASLTVQPGRPLVVEGCGAVSAASAPFAALRLWFALPDAERERRALGRDGAAFAAHWDRWAAQERRFIAREDPRSLADLVVDGRSFPRPFHSAVTAHVQ